MAKPTTKPGWNPNPTVTVEPSSQKKLTGWYPGEKPFATHFNWLFQNISQWIDYVDVSSTDLTNLDAALAAEILRAMAAESAEVIRAEAAEGAEIIRAEAAEAAINTRIDNWNVASGTILPVASAQLRGRLFLLLVGTGLPDTLYICAKDYLDNYKWFEIVLMNV